MKVAILGRTSILYKTIDKLIHSGHSIAIIGTCKAAPEYDVSEVDFEKKAMELGVPFFNNININDSEIVEEIKKANADIAVSVNWLTIIGEEVIGLFPYGVLNAHSGDLPRYRGNACPNWAIINGEKQFAISIHYMQPGELDSGDILVKHFYPITEMTDITEIYAIAEREIPFLFCEAIDKIDEGYRGKKQSENVEDILRCYPRIPTDSFIDWNMSCDEISKLVRASTYPFQGAYTFWGNKKIHIMRCKIKEYETPCNVFVGQVISRCKESGEVLIAASDGVVCIDKVVIDEKEESAAEILKSTRIRLNYCLEEEIFQLRKRIDILEDRICKLEWKK